MQDRQPKRQGDIRLVPVESRPRDGRKYHHRESGEGLIIAAGEQTGHHHRVRDTHTHMFEQGKQQFLRVPSRGAVLEHEEHAPIELEGGTYEVQRQREMVLPPVQEATSRRVSREPRWTNVWD